MSTMLHTGAAYDFTTTPLHSARSGPMPAVVLLAGWKSNSFSSTYSELAEKLRALGYHTMQLSLRGHEGSKGDINTVTRSDHAQDICYAIDWLQERPEVDINRIGAIGSSYGAYMLASGVQAYPGIKWLVLRAPALYPDEGWNAPTQLLLDNRDELRRWLSSIKTVGQSRALKSIAEYRGGLSLVWSEKEDNLPHAVLESYVKALGSDGAVRILMGDQHVLTGEPKQEFLAFAERWFKERLVAKTVVPAA